MSSQISASLRAAVRLPAWAARSNQILALPGSPRCSCSSVARLTAASASPAAAARSYQPSASPSVPCFSCHRPRL
ncbi:hypothetical protein ACFSTC_48400 [Nonomuraea ferruginea]